MNKQEQSLVVISVVLLVAWNIVVFFVDVPKTLTFWMADFFAVVAILFQLWVRHYTDKGDGTLMSKVYGLPILRVGLIYLVVQIFISLVSVALSQWIPAKIVVLLSVIALAMAIVGVILNNNAREIIQETDRQSEEKTNFMKDLEVRTSNIAVMEIDKDLSRRIQKFAEEIRYSDSVSSPVLSSIEDSLWGQIGVLEQAVSQGDKAVAVSALDEAIVLLEQRNNLCSRYKGKSV